jgi:2-pyrone-4,6-dicarboxylate lactonase
MAPTTVRLVNALQASSGRARGVATVDRRVTDAELRELHEAGVRGTRFNFVKRLVDFTPRDVLSEIAHRIAPLGWHVVVYFEAADLPDLRDFFTSLPTVVVVDHMGRPDVRKPVDGGEFELFVELLRDHGNIWSKVSCPERLSVSGPPALNGERSAYRDVVPFARRLVETFPDRVLWGTDWPHPNLKDHMPDDGLLVDFIPPHRDHTGTAAQAARGQSSATVLELTCRVLQPSRVCGSIHLRLACTLRTSGRGAARHRADRQARPHASEPRHPRR